MGIFNLHNLDRKRFKAVELVPLGMWCSLHFLMILNGTSVCPMSCGRVRPHCSCQNSGQEPDPLHTGTRSSGMALSRSQVQSVFAAGRGSLRLECRRRACACCLGVLN